MTKKNPEIIFFGFLVIILIVLAFFIGYKEGKGHKLTEDEIAASEITLQIKKERNHTNDTDDVIDIANRYVTEEPEIYEEYSQTQEIQSTEEVYQNPTPQHSQESDLTSDEIWEMTRIVYLENGITYPECTYETVYLTACVILNRLYDWGYDNVYDVIWDAGQYSTANRYEDYNGSPLGTSNPDGWTISEQAVSDAINDRDRNPHFQSTSAQGTVYYTDPYTGEVFSY